jgi:hypothetical protein
LILDEPQFSDAAASIRYVKTLPSHPEAVSVPICFVANFEQPIPASEYTCSRLAKLFGLSGIALRSIFTFDSPGSVAHVSFELSGSNAQQTNANNAMSVEGDTCLEALLVCTMNT